MKKTISLIATAALCLTGLSASAATQQGYQTQRMNDICPQCGSTTSQYYQTYESVPQPVHYETPTTISSIAYDSGYSILSSSSEVVVSASYAAVETPVHSDTIYQQPQRVQTVSYLSGSDSYYVSKNPTPGLAQQKAEQAASRGFRDHVGGSLGGARYEGVGWSNQSPQKAIENCCHWGVQTPAQIGISKSHDGCWYACVLYH